MSLFHRHDREEPEKPAEAASYEVVGPGNKILRYARDDFSQIFETTDAEEAQRQVEHGWVILAERQVEGKGRGPSGEDLVLGIGAVRASGALAYERGETATVYTVGYLKDDAHGAPVG